MTHESAEPRLFLVDTHCHLDMNPYKADLEAVLGRAAEIGVRQIITVGIDLASSRRAISLAEQYDHIFATVGVHPHAVAETVEADYDELRHLARHPKVVGLGEIGLDFFKKYAPEDLQIEHFRRQLQLAGELELPVIIHDRDAHRQVMAMLGEAAPFPAGGVMHCFSGDMALAEQSMELGFYISVPGIVTFNRAEELQDVAARVPLDSLLLETDGPYLAPIPKRGKRNEPGYLVHTARKVAALRGLTLHELAAATTVNAGRLFSLPSPSDCKGK